MPRFKRYDYVAMSARCSEEFNLYRPNLIAIDTETEGFAWEAPAFCVTLTWRDPAARLRSFYIDLDEDDTGERRAVLRHILGTAERWVFHNAKFDLQKLLLMDCIKREWIEAATIEDTNIIHALIDENSRHGLKYLATKLLGEDTNEEKVLAKVRRKLKIKKDEGYHLLPREVVVPYAMKDTEFTLRLYELLIPYMAEQRELYRSEVATAIALLDIEANGIALDVPYLEAAASEYGIKVMRGLQELQGLAYPECGQGGRELPQFNPNSPKQITEAFERMSLSVKSTAKEALTEIAEQEGNMPAASAFAAALLEYRKNKKLHSTYLVGMLAEQQDGILHPNFNLTLPRTGRMSSSAASNN